VPGDGGPAASRAGACRPPQRRGGRNATLEPASLADEGNMATSRARAFPRLRVVRLTPGNSRRSSTAADSSPPRSKAVWIAAASAPVTTNIPTAWERSPGPASAAAMKLPPTRVGLSWFQPLADCGCSRRNTPYEVTSADQWRRRPPAAQQGEIPAYAG
jgi:hypothetical protein